MWFLQSIIMLWCDVSLHIYRSAPISFLSECEPSLSYSSLESISWTAVRDRIGPLFISISSHVDRWIWMTTIYRQWLHEGLASHTRWLVLLFTKVAYACSAVDKQQYMYVKRHFECIKNIHRIFLLVSNVHWKVSKRDLEQGETPCTVITSLHRIVNTCNLQFVSCIGKSVLEIFRHQTPKHLDFG